MFYFKITFNKTINLSSAVSLPCVSPRLQIRLNNNKNAGNITTATEQAEVTEQ